MDIITEIMELFGAAYLGDFSKYMFQSGAYSTVFYIMLLLPVLVAFVYYIVLDHILLAKTRKWLTIGAVTCAVAALVAIFIANLKIGDYTFSQNIIDVGIASGDFLSFGFIVFAYSAVFYFISSLIFKSFSSRSRNIPF
jgi:hypothetical protein